MNLTKDRNVNERKLNVRVKVDNYEEAQASMISIKNKDDIVNAYFTSIKNKGDTFDKVEESRATKVSNIPD